MRVHLFFLILELVIRFKVELKIEFGYVLAEACHRHKGFHFYLKSWTMSLKDRKNLWFKNFRVDFYFFLVVLDFLVLLCYYLDHPHLNRRQYCCRLRWLI